MGCWHRKTTLSVKHYCWINCCAFSPNGSTVLHGSVDRTLRLYNAATGKQLWSVKHNNIVMCCAFSPDSYNILFGSIEYTLRLWSRPTFIKNKVETLFLLRQTNECQLSLLPRELIHEICRAI